MTDDQTDIAEHMPFLQSLASRSSVVIEIGVGNGNGSTRAFSRGLMSSRAENKCYISVDCNPDNPKERPCLSFWHLIIGRSEDECSVHRACSILAGRVPDIIFIDTDHTYEQMRSELEAWFPMAGPRTLWLFHDTWMNGEYNHMTDAIKEFTASHPEWRYADVTKACHGLGAMHAGRLTEFLVSVTE